MRDQYKGLLVGKNADLLLRKHLGLLFEKLRTNPYHGTKIKRRQWPKKYSEYALANLWKANLPGGYRLIYTLDSDVGIMMVTILEWLSHKEYEKRFGYSVK